MELLKHLDHKDQLDMVESSQHIRKAGYAMKSRVVILEISEQYSDTYSTLLKEAGCNQVLVINSYEQYVLMELECERAALFIVDIQFPKKADGLQALRRIRGNPRLMTIPIVVITELDEGDAKGVCSEYGVADYIIKPFKKERFLKTVSPLLIQQGDYASRFASIPEIQLSPMTFIERELKIAMRLKSPLSLIVVALVAQEKALSENGEDAELTSSLQKTVLETFKKNLRATDMVFMNDAGEIMAVLPATGATGAENVLGKVIGQLHNQLSENERKLSDAYYGISVSYPQDGDTLNDLIKAAFQKIDSKRQLEKVSASLHRNMGRTNYIYKQPPRKYR